MNQNKALLLFPTLDEGEALRRLILEVPKELDVLVVDSGSTDDTVSVAVEAGWACIPAEFGRGQGSGLRTGFKHFLKSDYEFLVFLDADYTDNPADIPKVLGELVKGDCEVVLGIRDFIKQKKF
ncbi:MAG: glycosyltransferase family 2 protein [Methanobacteriota archaeon]